MIIVNDSAVNYYYKALHLGCCSSPDPPLAVSIWLLSLPLKHGIFSLTKREFFDGVLLRYGWALERLPYECIYKAKCNIDHALTCKTREFVTFCHNEFVNVTADMLSMVCKNVRKEPTLSTTPSNNGELRADISVRSFCQRLQGAFVDARVFHCLCIYHQWWNEYGSKTIL